MDDETPSWFAAEWLTATGKRQKDLVEGTGIDKGDVSRLVARKMPWGEAHVRAFANVLGIPRGWLLDVDPTDPTGDLPLLKAWRSIPKHQRPTILAMIEGAASTTRKANDHEPPSAPPLSKTTRRRGS